MDKISAENLGELFVIPFTREEVIAIGMAVSLLDAVPTIVDVALSTTNSPPIIASSRLFKLWKEISESLRIMIEKANEEKSS